MQIDTYAEDTVKSLLRESDLYKAEAVKQKKSYEELERRVYERAIEDTGFPTEVVRRMNQLENETERYRFEIKELRENLKAAESEMATLQDKITGQKNMLKGAGKKVRNAKDVAGKQEEKAKSAVHDKQLRASSERKMRQERTEAVAEVASLTRLCDDLQVALEVERSGRPHLCKSESASDMAVEVILIELTINRAHFLQPSTIFDSNQISITEQMQRWYDDLKKLKEPTRQVVGANYMSGKRSDRVAVKLDKLYTNMVELVDGHQHPGTEHGGPRSEHILETICRKAEERHNGQN